MIYNLISAILGIFILGLLALLGMTSTQITYEPKSEELPAWLKAGTSPMYVAEEFLNGSKYLPRSGAQIRCCTSAPEWDIDNLSEVVQPDREITNVSIESIRISSFQSLISDIIDDDPIVSASVDTVITTADGKTTHLAIELWDYGLLTPWSMYPKGDGWKPVKVVYGN